MTPSPFMLAGVCLSTAFLGASALTLSSSTATSHTLRSGDSLETPDGKCLKFMHIPKTAGKSIEIMMKGNSTKFFTNGHSFGNQGKHNKDLKCGKKADCLSKKAKGTTGCEMGRACEIADFE